MSPTVFTNTLCLASTRKGAACGGVPPVAIPRHPQSSRLEVCIASTSHAAGPGVACIKVAKAAWQEEVALGRYPVDHWALCQFARVAWGGTCCCYAAQQQSQHGPPEDSDLQAEQHSAGTQPCLRAGNSVVSGLVLRARSSTQQHVHFNDCGPLPRDAPEPPRA